MVWKALAGLLLLSMIWFSVSLPGRVDAQSLATSTQAPVMLAPTMRLKPDLLRLPAPVLKSETVKSGLVFKKAELSYSNLFAGSMDIENPEMILLGNSGAVHLVIIPSLFSSDSSISAMLNSSPDKVTVVADPHSLKPVNGTTPLKWTWLIDPKVPGEHILLLYIAYQGNSGNANDARWDNLEISLLVAAPTATWTPTYTATSSSTPTSTPTITPSFTLTPITFTPTFTPTPTTTVTSTPTLTNSQKIATALVNNPAPVIGTIVTLLLGLLTLYFNVRKGGKK
jgi:hypothetical protein